MRGHTINLAQNVENGINSRFQPDLRRAANRIKWPSGGVARTQVKHPGFNPRREQSFFSFFLALGYDFYHCISSEKVKKPNFSSIFVQNRQIYGFQWWQMVQKPFRIFQTPISVQVGANCLRNSFSLEKKTIDYCRIPLFLHFLPF